MNMDTIVLSFGAVVFANGAICGLPQFRVRAQAILSSRGERRSLAAAIAAAIGNNSVEDVQRIANEKLRYITFDRIDKADLEGAPTESSVQALFQRSVPGKFGEIDAFISHSWHDPFDEKWDELQAWRERFKAREGREPRIWFDKCCIDQLNIEPSLMCLPVHLAACNTVLVVAGPTYLERMWCVLEIFVLIAAVDDMSRLECIPLRAMCKRQLQPDRFSGFMSSLMSSAMTGRMSQQSGTYDPGGGMLEVSANVGRLVLGCIEAKFCKEIQQCLLLRLLESGAGSFVVCFLRKNLLESS